ncbi:exodeoxyribonuclease III [Anaeromassilibacillus sp. An200]|uniref:Exodeoxyribonuclease III n=1 Tax=Candidatus Caccousia stercoris TaxID=2840723 RepID=A0A9D1FTB1_9FIRM|nr:exodeoxyribonuclease III [Anaeromassilibacillus sp. An200]OUP14352.1 exodeoxyribonuclease III [Anaeromassilibacillus sp. An200]HIS79651.1 exodeoxyribonuclease III [Candidatus Caccousia stercoris]
MKLVSWNVNGLRACLGKGFLDYFRETDADVFCLQETKMQPGQAELDLPGYAQYWNSAEKKGYSGTAVFSRREPLSVRNDIGDPVHVGEGRAITLEFPEFFLVTVYTPNAQDGLARIDYRMEWEDAFRAYLLSLDAEKPVVVCGDMNVAHEEIDLKNPKTNRGNAGFSDQERGKMTELLASGFTDTFRYFHPDLTGAYSWWSYRFRAREKNAGWRIDYFLTSDRLRDRLVSSTIRSDIFGSDHCPVELVLRED